MAKSTSTANTPKKSAKQIVIVVASFNELITKSLLHGCQDELALAGILDVQVIHVPGCFEIPVTCVKVAESIKPDAIIAIGAVIRGETPHFDIVANESARGLMDVSLRFGVPVINTILTTDTVEQALNRSGLKHGNKGREGAHAALQMANTLSSIEHS